MQQYKIVVSFQAWLPGLVVSFQTDNYQDSNILSGVVMFLVSKVMNLTETL